MIADNRCPFSMQFPRDQDHAGDLEVMFDGQKYVFNQLLLATQSPFWNKLIRAIKGIGTTLHQGKNFALS